jgi:RNA polymerase sigma-54 factor
MALMPGLQINIGQQLKLTPQLQQSIKILQYSALEVQQTIEQTLEANYMLEVGDDLLEESEEESLASLNEMANETTVSEEAPVDIEHSETIKDDIGIDMDWNEVFGDHNSSVAKSSSEDYVSAETYTSAEESLFDRLSWQSDIYPWDRNDSVLAAYIIDDINDEGYLESSLEDILISVTDNESGLSIDTSDLERVLGIIQQFEPTGVGARNVQESLILQLDSKAQNPFVVTATKLIEDHFDWLSYHDTKRIKKVYGLDDDDLHQVLRLIQSLNPRPGREFSSSESEIIIPDLRLRRSSDKWLVELNTNAFPRLQINAAYVDLTSSLGNDEQSKKIKEQVIEAKGLIKSIQSRGETLLRVGKFIVEKQREFFEQGEYAMQPLVLRDVAEHLELHESTISRATNKKYIQTPRGTYELKYFFSTGVSQYGSADQSAIAIKAHIKELIESEDPKKPLSDNKLMSLLEEKEIVVARRTIAKYREALKIPSSSERKKLNQFKL